MLLDREQTAPDAEPCYAAVVDIVERQDFREAMSRLGAAVNLVTTDGPCGRYGVTASAVCAVTDAPPTVVVCLNQGNASYEAFKVNQRLAVNVLGERHESLAARFSTRGFDSEARFNTAEWTKLSTGAPCLLESVAVFDCRVQQIVEVGTHGMFICEVKSLSLSSKVDGLIYFGRRYHGLRT